MENYLGDNVHGGEVIVEYENDDYEDQLPGADTQIQLNNDFVANEQQFIDNDASNIWMFKILTSYTIQITNC